MRLFIHHKRDYNYEKFLRGSVSRLGSTTSHFLFYIYYLVNLDLTFNNSINMHRFYDLLFILLATVYFAHCEESSESIVKPLQETDGNLKIL